MTRDQIKKELDSFIDFPPCSDGMYVTTVSALLFAEHIAKLAASREREECATACETIYSNLNSDKDCAKRWPQQKQRNDIYAQLVRARGKQ